MDQNLKIKTVLFGGFSKESVLTYIESLLAEQEKERTELATRSAMLSDAILTAKLEATERLEQIKLQEEQILYEAKKQAQEILDKANCEAENKLQDAKQQHDEIMSSIRRLNLFVGDIQRYINETMQRMKITIGGGVGE